MKTLTELYNDLPLIETPIWGDESHPGGSDKGTTHSYLETYDKLFSELRHTPVKMLEIGAAYGGSAKLFDRYFDDLHYDAYEIECHSFPDTVKLFEEKENFNLVCKNALHDEEPRKNGKSFYDIILDDGSHYLNDQILAARLWFASLKTGGYYIIEDVWKDHIEELASIYPNPNIIDLREERIYKITDGVTFCRDDNIIIYWKK